MWSSVILLFVCGAFAEGQIPFNGLSLSNSETYMRLIIPNATLQRREPPTKEDLAQFADFDFDPQLIFDIIMAKIQEANIPITPCTEDMMRAIMSKNVFPYADSWGAKPSGLLSNNYRWLGDFDQCLSIERMIRADNQTSFGPHYCLGSFGNQQLLNMPTQRPTIMNFNMGFFIGMCLPETCQIQDIAQIAALAGEFLPMLGEEMQFIPQSSRCIDNNPPLDNYAIVAIACYSVMAFLLALGLAVDIYRRVKMMFRPHVKSPIITSKKSAEPVTTGQHFAKLLLCCSPLTNFEKLFKTTLPSGPANIDLNAVNGIRALSLFWVILGHVYTFLQGSIDNEPDIYNLGGRVTFQGVMAGLFAVDSFFFLSGFLAYYSLSRVYAKIKTSMLGFASTLPHVYFHRYMRLTPPYAATILLNLGLWRYLSSGPLYFQGTDWHCANNWWANLLYVSNFVDLRHACINWSWYLPVDMQLFILSPFVVFALVKMPVFGWGLATMGIVIHMVASATLTVVHHLPPTQFPPVGHAMELFLGTATKDYQGYFEYYYTKPYCRGGPYIVGLLVCHIVIQHQDWLRRHFFPKLWLQVLGWILCFGTMGALVYGLTGVYNNAYISPEYADAIYNALARLAWAMALGWVMLCCATKRGGLVSDFLSWSPWAVVSRLSYCAYLLHPLVILFYNHTTRRPIHMDDVQMIFLFVGTLFNTLIVSVVLSLGFESPFIGLLQNL